MKSSKKNTASDVVVSDVVVSDVVVSTPSIDSLPAIPAMFDRLRRLNHGIETLRAKATLLELAIDQAPINLQAISDDKRINAYIASQATFGVEMTRQQAVSLLQIVRLEQPVTLTGTRIPVSIEREKNDLLLKENDKEIVSLYQKYGFLTQTRFIERIQVDKIVVSAAVLNRYVNIAKQVAYLQGKESNNGCLHDVCKQVDMSTVNPIAILDSLDNHPKAQKDKSTIALTKRAVKIWYHLSN
jgi:hypothetical protein